MSARCGQPHLRGRTSRVQNPKLPARGTLRRRAFDRLTALHSRVYRASGGRIGGRYRYGSRMLLLDHVGRRSGQVRTAPLVYMPHDGGWAVVAAAGASEDDPQWLLNLRANPECSVTVGSRRRQVVAHVASPEEKRAIWPQLIEHNPTWDDYQRRTSRDIPVVFLRPVA